MMTNHKKYVKEKTKRQELIKGWNQERLKKAKVFIAGVGALGNEVLKNLAQAGVGNLILVDMDEIEYSNLNRTVLFQKKDVGKKKAVIAAQSLKRIAPDIKVKVYADTLQSILSEKAGVFRDIDVLLGCLDNMEARFLLNHASVRFRIPYVDGGYIGFSGSVQVIIPPYTPCLECNATKITYSNIGRRYSCTAGDFIDLTEEERRVRIPAVSVTASIISAIQSKEALKILLGLENFRRHGIWPSGIGGPLKNVLQYNGKTNKLMITRLEKNPECYVCGSNIDVSLASTFYRSEMIETNSNESLVKLKEKIRDLLQEQEFNLITNFEAAPNFEKVYTVLQETRTKLRFLMRGIRKMHGSNEKSINIDYEVFQELLESSLFHDPETMYKLIVNKKPVQLTELENLFRQISEIAKKREDLSEEINEVIKKMSKSFIWIRKTLSGTMSLAELGFQPLQELYAVHSKDSKTASDVLILLSMKS